MEQKKDHYRPFAFFLIVISFTWIPWFFAATLGKAAETEAFSGQKPNKQRLGPEDHSSAVSRNEY